LQDKNLIFPDFEISVQLIFSLSGEKGFLKICFLGKNFSKLYEDFSIKIFEVAESESDFIFSKFKMVDPI